LRGERFEFEFGHAFLRAARREGERAAISSKNLPVSSLHEACTGSNQLGSDGPGLPASPQPGLMGTGWVDDVFFGEKHGVDGL
jgi:hypothetical protein